MAQNRDGSMTAARDRQSGGQSGYTTEGRTWTDSDGRTCSWRYTTDAYGASNYRQVCR